MTLIRHLADLKLNAEERTTTTILLIDEPELYLHPQAIEILRESLKTLSKQGYQIIFSTHSPFMITEKDVANTILVRKNQQLGTHKRNSLKSAIPTVVQQGGSGNTKKSMLVLNTMDLPCKAIVDLDYAFKHGISDGFIQANDLDIAACIAELAILAPANGIVLDNNLPTNRNSSMSAAEAYALLAQRPNIKQNILNLKAKLQAQGIWIWTKGTIEKHLNINGKTEQVWARFTNDIETNGLEATLPNDHAEVRDCINWVLN